MLLFLSHLAFGDTGTLLLHTFGTNSLPKPYSEVLLLQENGTSVAYRSDEFGVLLLSLEEGRYQVQWESHTKDVDIVSGDEAMIIFSATHRDEMVSSSPQDMIVEKEEPNQDVEWVLLEGRIEDWDGNGLSGARILVRGGLKEAVSDADGRFSLSVESGVLDLVVLKEGYIEKSISHNIVSPSTVAEMLRVVLSPAGYELSDVNIVAPRIEGSASTMLAKRKESSSVGEQLGAEQMSRSGDSDAASALKRVTGLTVVGGKYVYVRGLGERYSASLLNGATLPSTEPERRVVPLDLFPTSLLQGINIQKTFSPDRPAEFGGGIVSLETRGIPEEPIFRLGVSSGFTEGNTGQIGDMGVGYAGDWTGFGAGARALPALVDEASTDSPLEEKDMFSTRGYSAKDLELFGEQIDPQRWSLEEKMALPPMGIDVLGGRGWKKGGIEYGFLAAGLWKNDWDVDSFDRNYYLLGEDSQLEQSHVYHFDDMSNNIRLSGAVISSVLWGSGSVQTTTLFNRSSSLRARWYEGFNRDVATDIRVMRTGWTERTLFFQQLKGEQSYDDWKLSARYSYSQAGRAEPDRREYRYDYEPSIDSWFISDRPEGNSIFYSTLVDHNHDVSVQLSKTFQFGKSERDSLWSIGFGGVQRDRGVDTRRYKFMHKGAKANDFSILSNEAIDIFHSDNIGPDGFQFEEVTRQTDNYSANQNIISAFAMGDVKIGRRLGVLTGLRLEKAIQNVETFALFNPDQEPVLATLDNTDILPALTLTYDMGPEQETDQMRIRFGYGRTLSRPDFRELSPATFNDVTGGRQVYGNPDLKRALMDNLDARWEWYPTPEESLSIGTFYKDFTQPIESIVVVSAQHSVTYQNAERAKNLGLELDGRIAFSRLHPQLEGVFIGGNASWIHSNVILGENSGIQSSDVRALEGQSPYVYNLQFSYEQPDNLWGSTLLYNVFGARIMQVGALGAPDYLELPVHRLDWVSFVNSGSFRWGIRVQNLLDAPIRVQTGNALVESRSIGRSIGVQLRWQPTE